MFDCAMGERSISAMGHVRMMAAAQPFLSGAISKTVNLPETATVEDVEEVYYQGWKMGLKALAIYRNNCKVGQPLSDAREKKADVAVAAPTEYKPVRKRLPKRRPSQTVSFAVAGAEGYLTAGSYPDDGLGEVFLKLGKQGSTLAGVMDAFSIAISIALQYGVPLEAFVSKFVNMRFDPAGLTDDPDVRMAQSIMDYIFRRLALDYLPYDNRAELGIFTASSGRRPSRRSTATTPALRSSTTSSSTSTRSRSQHRSRSRRPSRWLRSQVPSPWTPMCTARRNCSSVSWAPQPMRRCAWDAAPRCARPVAATSAKAAAAPAAAADANGS